MLLYNCKKYKNCCHKADFKKIAKIYDQLLEFNLFVLKKREEDRDKSKINKDKKTNMNKRKKTDFKSALDNFWFNFLPNELSLERFQHVY